MPILTIKIDVNDDTSEITQELLIDLEFFDEALVVDNDVLLDSNEAKEIQIPELITQSNQKIQIEDVC